MSFSELQDGLIAPDSFTDSARKARQTQLNQALTEQLHAADAAAQALQNDQALLRQNPAEFERAQQEISHQVQMAMMTYQRESEALLHQMAHAADATASQGVYSAANTNFNTASENLRTAADDSRKASNKARFKLAKESADTKIIASENRAKDLKSDSNTPTADLVFPLLPDANRDETHTLEVKERGLPWNSSQVFHANNNDITVSIPENASQKKRDSYFENIANLHLHYGITNPNVSELDEKYQGDAIKAFMRVGYPLEQINGAEKYLAGWPKEQRAKFIADTRGEDYFFQKPTQEAYDAFDTAVAMADSPAIPKSHLLYDVNNEKWYRVESSDEGTIFRAWNNDSNSWQIALSPQEGIMAWNPKDNSVQLYRLQFNELIRQDLRPDEKGNVETYSEVYDTKNGTWVNRAQYNNSFPKENSERFLGKVDRMLGDLDAVLAGDIPNKTSELGKNPSAPKFAGFESLRERLESKREKLESLKAQYLDPNTSKKQKRKIRKQMREVLNGGRFNRRLAAVRRYQANGNQAYNGDQFKTHLSARDFNRFHSDAPLPHEAFVRNLDKFNASEADFMDPDLWPEPEGETPVVPEPGFDKDTLAQYESYFKHTGHATHKGLMAEAKNQKANQIAHDGVDIGILRARDTSNMAIDSNDADVTALNNTAQANMKELDRLDKTLAGYATQASNSLDKLQQLHNDMVQNAQQGRDNTELAAEFNETLESYHAATAASRKISEDIRDLRNQNVAIHNVVTHLTSTLNPDLEYAVEIGKQAGRDAGTVTMNTDTATEHAGRTLNTKNNKTKNAKQSRKSLNKAKAALKDIKTTQKELKEIKASHEDAVKYAKDNMPNELHGYLDSAKAKIEEIDAELKAVTALIEPAENAIKDAEKEVKKAEEHADLHKKIDRHIDGRKVLGIFRVSGGLKGDIKTVEKHLNTTNVKADAILAKTNDLPELGDDPSDMNIAIYETMILEAESELRALEKAQAKQETRVQRHKDWQTGIEGMLNGQFHPNNPNRNQQGRLQELRDKTARLEDKVLAASDKIDTATRRLDALAQKLNTAKEIKQAAAEAGPAAEPAAPPAAGPAVPPPPPGNRGGGGRRPPGEGGGGLPEMPEPPGGGPADPVNEALNARRQNELDMPDVPDVPTAEADANALRRRQNVQAAQRAPRRDGMAGAGGLSSVGRKRTQQAKPVDPANRNDDGYLVKPGKSGGKQ